MNDVATQRVGLQTTTEVATGHTRALFDIKEVLKLKLYSFIADNMPFNQLLRARRADEPPDIDLFLLARLLRWKLSFDGIDCGDKKMPTFYLVPLSLVKSNQPEQCGHFSVTHGVGPRKPGIAQRLRLRTSR